jgi:ribosomal protein S18 acetylase RimI-like enzyme
MFKCRTPSATWTLRSEVNATDRDAVRTIVERTGFFRPDEVEIAVELVDEHLAAGNASGYRFVFAESLAKVIGYVCFGPIPCTLTSFDLYWIAVDPEHQRCGLGRALIDEAAKQIAAAGGQRIYIDTSGQPKYAPTRGFYERSGFRCEARLVDFYAPGDDRIIYGKVINSDDKPRT